MRKWENVLFWPCTASCSVILGRSDPPTNPMTAFCRTAFKTSRISGEAVWNQATRVRTAGQHSDACSLIVRVWLTRRAGVRVPSTSVSIKKRVELNFIDQIEQRFERERELEGLTEEADNITLRALRERSDGSRHVEWWDEKKRGSWREKEKRESTKFCWSPRNAKSSGIPSLKGVPRRTALTDSYWHYYNMITDWFTIHL